MNKYKVGTVIKLRLKNEYYVITYFDKVFYFTSEGFGYFEKSIGNYFEVIK